jgi:hypothetical protein
LLAERLDKTRVRGELLGRTADIPDAVRPVLDQRDLLAVRDLERHPPRRRTTGRQRQRHHHIQHRTRHGLDIGLDANERFSLSLVPVMPDRVITQP